MRFFTSRDFVSKCLSSIRVKCLNCNTVISEILASMQNKLDVMDESSLIRICTSAFSDEDIEVAKSLLYVSR